jgi:hypothetical protein
MVRDHNTIATYDVVKATELAVTKIVGYTAVVSALAPRMAPDASVLLFGGVAKDYPHFGSTTVTAATAEILLKDTSGGPPADTIRWPSACTASRSTTTRWSAG